MRLCLPFTGLADCFLFSLIVMQIILIFIIFVFIILRLFVVLLLLLLVIAGVAFRLRYIGQIILVHGRRDDWLLC